MDHLPTLRNPVQPYPQVPYYGSDPLLQIPFYDVPKQRGWDLDKLRKGNWRQGHDKGTTIGFLQDWLYFSLLFELSVASGKKLPKLENHVRNPKRNPTVTGNHLNEFINKCVASIAEKNKKKRLDTLDQLEVCLSTASQAVTQVHRPRDLQESVMLSIMVLGSSIDMALVEHEIVILDRSWGLASDFAVPMMQQYQWCPRDISLAKSTLSEISMFCASHLSRRNELDKVINHLEHNCTSQYCKVNQVDENNYKILHMMYECACELWPPEGSTFAEDLKRMIHNNKIPCIELKYDDQDSLVPSLSSLDDAAMGSKQLSIFSHVWSDGLGNPKENRLPLCQLKRFHAIINTLPRRKHWAGRSIITGVYRIWIDTLCIPLDHETRKKAIGMLKRYYSYANVTIVLDKSLNTLSRADFSSGELLLRIALSPWMSRCWTMEEAVLAGSTLSIPFADGWMFPLDEVAHIRMRNLSLFTGTMNDDQQRRIKEIRKRIVLAGGAYLALSIAINPVVGVLALVPVGGWPVFVTGLMAYHWRREGAVLVDKPPLTVRDRLVQDARFFFSHISKLNAQHYYMPIFPARNRTMQDAALIERVCSSWNGLCFRDTSKPWDRFTIFSFLVARSTEEYSALAKALSENKKERVRHWYLSQSVVPCGLMFIRGAKLDVPGPRQTYTRSCCMTNMRRGA
jgi:hypothetical protein